MGRKPKHSKGLRQKDNGDWYLDIRVKGIRKRIDLGTKFLAEAELQATIERKNVAEKIELIEDRENGSLYQFFTRYEKWHAPPQKSWSTANLERVIIRVVKKYWKEDLPITDVTIDMCENLFLDLSRRSTPIKGSNERKPVSTYTLNLYLFTLRMMFRQAAVWKLINKDENPFMSLKEYDEKKKRPRILTEDEQKRFFEVLYRRMPQHADLMMFYLYTGVRRAEALRLEWKDVNFKEEVFYVTGKGEIPRTIPFFKRTKEIFLKRKAMELTRPFVDAPKAAAITLAFGRISEEAGIDAKLHDLRKTCATELASKGVHKLMLKQWIGQVDDEVTIDGYVDLIDEATKRKMDDVGLEKKKEFEGLQKSVDAKKEEESLARKKTLNKEKRERNHDKIIAQKKVFYMKNKEELNKKRRDSRRKAS